VPKSNRGKPRPTNGKSRRSPSGSRKSARIKTNTEAVEDVIEWLYERDAIGKVDSATVAIARTLAGLLDAPKTTTNARLWKEYREALEVLIRCGQDRKHEFDDVLRGLEASLRDNAPR